MDYLEKLKDPRWQKKRLEIFQRDNWECKWCGQSFETLHVHHIMYFKGDPWDINSAFLETICESCHILLSNGTYRYIECIAYGTEGFMPCGNKDKSCVSGSGGSCCCGFFGIVDFGLGLLFTRCIENSCDFSMQEIPFQIKNGKSTN